MATEKVVCDTDVMIDYSNVKNERHSDAKALVENRIGVENIILSTITKMELIIGAQNKPDLIKTSKSLVRYNMAFLDVKITNLLLN